MIPQTAQGLGTVGHPGIFIGQAKDFLGIRNHIDIPYVISLAPEQPYDLGLLDLWALKQRTDSPMLSLAIDNAQVVRTDADYYEFQLPSAQEQTTRLVSGGLDRDKFGMDEEEIPFIINRRDLSPGAVFSFDQTSRISFTVVGRQIEQLGKTQFKLWAKLNTNGAVKYVTKAEFVPQRQIVKLADITSLDFTSYKSTWSISSMGNAKYRNYISNARLQQSYRVTTGAVEFLNHKTRFDQAQLRAMETAVLQFYTLRGIGADGMVLDLNNANVYKQWFDRVQQEKANGNGEMMMISMLDNIAVGLMQKQNNNVMMWSPGINQLRDGYDTTRLIPGVWFQLDQAGYKHSYSLDSFSLATIANAIRDFEAGKVAPSEYINQKRYKVRTGMGGMELIYKAFMKEGYQVQAVVNNADHGFLQGDANNLVVRQPRIVEMQIPGLGFLRPELEPGFDPINADDFINPMLSFGHRLSSYTMLIEDYDMSGDNIVILRKNGDNIRMIVEAGTQTHPYFRGRTNAGGVNMAVHQASDEKTGYEVKFLGTVDTAIVKDPTRLLKLVPKNPKTGRASL